MTIVRQRNHESDLRAEILQRADAFLTEEFHNDFRRYDLFLAVSNYRLCLADWKRSKRVW